MITSPEQLDAFLDILQDRGVEEFAGFGIHVRFIVDEVKDEVQPQLEPKIEVKEVRTEFIQADPPKSIWEEPSLWPGGIVPKFPGKEDK
jgi:hypothetical protein